MGVGDFFTTVTATVGAPANWLRENFVKPNQQEYVWYHRKFKRVPTFDQCYTDDIVCFEEADKQHKRDKMVDDEIIAILKRREEECMIREGPDRKRKCASLAEDYENATTNWFYKYGDQGAYRNIRKAYMRQKHRMVWERRHGPLGGDTSVPEPIVK